MDITKSTQDLALSDFDFDLPNELIATVPVEPRDHSRLLVYDRKTREIKHHHFYELPRWITAEDLLVFNNTKVIAARILGLDALQRPTEIFLLNDLGDGKWRCLVKPGRRVKNNLVVHTKDNKSIEVFRTDEGTFTAQLPIHGTELHSWLETVGDAPIPPYFKRPATQEDKTRYQTVYAEKPGSIAAPTAGLHFTNNLLEELRSQGTSMENVTLHVGYGTFAPIIVEKLGDHQMHRECYEIAPDVWRAIQNHRKLNKKVICVGSTSLRTVESARLYGPIGDTSLFITPGYNFQMAGGLITNFHLPKSTLFVLLASLIGVGEAHRCYQTAIENRYRFYSYGDAMLIL